MANRKAPEPPAPLRLVYPEAEARQKLQTQIDKGVAIRDRAISSHEVLDQALQEKYRWSDFNEQLLLKLFNHNQEILRQYRQIGIGVDYDRMPLDKAVKFFRDDLDYFINRLQSVLESLELFVEDGKGSQLVLTDTKHPTIQKEVFVVHGRDVAAKQSVARFLERLELTPIILQEQVNAGQTIIEKFLKHSATAGFAVVLLTGDDVGGLKGSNEENPRARQNVILEFGYFLGTLGRERVCALYQKGVELPSDVLGVLHIEMDPADAWQVQLAKEMKHAGIPFDANKLL